VTPAYFDALGVPLKLGRAFTDADTVGSEPVALVNEELARHLWPGRNPVGEPLRLGSPGDDAPIVTVVGVVGTVRRSGMHDVVVARAFVPFNQHPNPMLSLVVRSRGDQQAAGRALEAAVRRADGELPVDGLRTLDADIGQFVAPIRLIARVLTGFAAAGMLLAALGVFGTMRYTVSQRQREMAIRCALGASGGDILRLVFARAVWLTAAGVILGIAGTLVATRALLAFLFGVSPTDPGTIALVAGFLTLVALMACYLPAHTAATVDPVPLLRRE
jgi:hypothetical protein